MSKLNKGFTLIEILVVVIIIAILSGVAFVNFDRFIERTRASEAEKIFGLAIYAQERRAMRYGQYTFSWSKLDSMPRDVKSGSDYLTADGRIYYTQGGTSDDTAPLGGYKIFFQNIGSHWFVVSERVGNPRYSYTLLRSFKDEHVHCVPAEGSRTDGLFCATFLGVDSPEEVPADPRAELTEENA